MNRTRRRAVAPVIATLLMIAVAVAVAMSVIIFMWSQGLLSQTSSATGSQQGARNEAAQSSIAIELTTFTESNAAGTCGNAGRPCGTTIVVRNVGAVGVTLGSLEITGMSSNSGFIGSLTISSLTGVTAACTSPQSGLVVASDGTTGWTACASTSLANIIPKGEAITLTLSSTTGTTTSIVSGDVLNIKVTTNVGTFAQSQITAP